MRTRQTFIMTERLVNELNAGENVTKEDKLNYFLLTLPESMSHMVD